MSDDLSSRLKQFAELRDAGLVTDEEFENLRRNAVGEAMPNQAKPSHRVRNAAIVGVAGLLVGGIMTLALVLRSGEESVSEATTTAVTTSVASGASQYCGNLLTTDPADFGFQNGDIANVDALNGLTREAAVAYTEELARFGGLTVVERFRLDEGSSLRRAADDLIDNSVALSSAITDRLNFGNEITIRHWSDFRTAYEAARSGCLADG